MFSVFCTTAWLSEQLAASALQVHTPLSRQREPWLSLTSMTTTGDLWQVTLLAKFFQVPFLVRKPEQQSLTPKPALEQPFERLLGPSPPQEKDSEERVCRLLKIIKIIKNRGAGTSSGCHRLWWLLIIKTLLNDCSVVY